MGPGASATTSGSKLAAEDLTSAAHRLSVIESKTRWQPIDFAELWRYRELLFFFTWRDIKVRYKQTELGAAWIILQPLITTGVFVVLFGALLGKDVPTIEGVPYALSTFSAMIVWQLFAGAVTRSGESLLSGTDLITKVYFPRLILPLSTVLAVLVDFFVALAALAAIMFWFGFAPPLAVVTLPLFVLLAVASALAIGLWLSALAAVYRDFRHVQPFLISIGMYISPVVYTTASITHLLPDWALFLYRLNPLVGAIEGFRWALFGEPALTCLVVMPSVLLTVVLLVGGAYFFRRMEQTVVDVI